VRVVLHEVLTTEKVPFTYRVAGLGSRFLAWLVDLLALILFALPALFYTGVLEGGRPGLGQAIFQLWLFLLAWGYFLLFEWLWDGQTLGKRLLGIRVIRRNGTSLAFVGSALRNIVRIVDLLPFFYALGFAVSASNRQNLRLGDLAADTLVVHLDRRGGPVQAILDAESDKACVALLRQRLNQLDREQRQTLLDLCLRRDQLRVAERARLFRATSLFVQEHLDLAPAEYESDEKFVLKLAAALGERN
jgi:uncharacterized RDD family membrane protein YckC